MLESIAARNVVNITTKLKTNTRIMIFFQPFGIKYKENSSPTKKKKEKLL